MWRPTRVTPLIQTQTHSSIFMLNSSEVSIVGKCRKYTHTQMKLLISVETSQTTYREVRYSLLFYYIILLLSPMQSFCLCNFLVKVIIHNARMIISKFKFLKYISTSTYTHPPPPPHTHTHSMPGSSCRHSSMDHCNSHHHSSSCARPSCSPSA